MRTSFLIALTSIVLGACAANPPQAPQALRYTKYGTTQGEFMKDRYACIQDAQQRVSGAYVDPYGGASSSKVVINCGMVTACMGARGYVVDPNGNLTAPPGMVVECQR